MTSRAEPKPSTQQRTAEVLPFGGVRRLPAYRRDWTSPETPDQSPRPFTQGALALTYTLNSGVPSEPPGPILSVVAPLTEPTRTVPDPQVWASRFVQAVVEVMSSDRPLTQLVRWTSSEVYREVAVRQSSMTRQRGTTGRLTRHQVSSVHVSQPHSYAAEIAARVTVGRRSRLIAARLDFQRGRWLCTTICFG